MKVPKYLSPSAVSTWLESQEQYFLKYLAVDRPPRILQNQAMAVGSSFDAYIKSYLYQRLFGKSAAHNEGFDFDTIFESQCELQNRDFALKAGANCFIAYKASGALSQLFETLQKADGPPMMEFTALGASAPDGATAGIYRAITPPDSVPVGSAGPVVLLGKPDLFFRVPEASDLGINLIYDFKVNGYVSKTGKNPLQGYLYLMDGFEPKSKNHGHIHKDAVPYEEYGLHYSLHPNIEMYQPDWGRQLCVYSWICGAPVGGPMVVGVDQLCCKPSYPSPNISVALHRCTVTKKFQLATYRLFQLVWDIIHSDWIFRSMSKEQSAERVDVLLKQANAYSGDDVKTKWLNSLRGKGQ